jgi:hypothetical protein
LIHQHLTLLACSTNLNPTIICVTGASIAGLAVLIYANRHQSTAINPEPELPAAKFTNQDITQRFVAFLPEITRELKLEVATASSGQNQNAQARHHPSGADVSWFLVKKLDCRFWPHTFSVGTVRLNQTPFRSASEPSFFAICNR